MYIYIFFFIKISKKLKYKYLEIKSHNFNWEKLCRILSVCVHMSAQNSSNPKNGLTGCLYRKFDVTNIYIFQAATSSGTWDNININKVHLHEEGHAG